MDVSAEETEAAGLVCGDELLKEQSPEQAGEQALRQEKAGSTRYPAETSRAKTTAADSAHAAVETDHGGE